MVDVYVHRMLEEPQADEDAGCGALLAVLGMPPPEATRLDIGITLDQLAYDPAEPERDRGRGPGGAIRRAQRARGDLRRDVGVPERDGTRRCRVSAGPPSDSDPHVYLQFVRERAALFFGLADSTMSHDDAWRFLVLGRNVERVDMTAQACCWPGCPPRRMSSAGRCCCGVRRVRVVRPQRGAWTGGGARHVAEFLVLDPLFPRSVLHSLATAEECLVALDPETAGGRR